MTYPASRLKSPETSDLTSTLLLPICDFWAPDSELVLYCRPRERGAQQGGGSTAGTGCILGGGDHAGHPIGVEGTFCPGESAPGGLYPGRIGPPSLPGPLPGVQLAPERTPIYRFYPPPP